MSLKRIRPATVRIDDLVNLPPNAHRLVQSDDDAVVVRDVVGGEDATGLASFWAAFLEPLLADPVATDMEVPDFRPYAVEPNRASDFGFAGSLLLASVDPNRVVRTDLSCPRRASRDP